MQGRHTVVKYRCGQQRSNPNVSVTERKALRSDKKAFVEEEEEDESIR